MGSFGLLSRLGTVILVAVLASLVVAQLGLTMTSVVTSACASLAVSCVLAYVDGLRPGSVAPTLCGLLALCAVLPSEGARDYAELLGVSLAVGVVLLLLSIAPVRNGALSGIPAHLRVGMSALLGVLSVEFVLRLCGMVTVDSNGALGLVGIFDPAFVDASISLLATVTLRCSGVPAAGILGFCIATFAGIPLGLTQAPAGFLAAPDVTLIASSSSDLVAGAARLLQGLFSARSLGLIFSLALCLLSTSDAEPEDASRRRSGQVLGALGMLASAFLGIPMIGLVADQPKESRQRPLWRRLPWWWPVCPRLWHAFPSLPPLALCLPAACARFLVLPTLTSRTSGPPFPFWPWCLAGWSQEALPGALLRAFLLTPASVWALVRRVP